jgi:dTDP-glucose 4,6-dehydratase
MTLENTKKRALITGACGFIGHALLEELLLNTDYDIVCLDRLDISGTLDRVKSVIDKCPESVNAHNRVSFVYHDLKAEINEYTRVKIGDINYVFHLAAGSHVDRSIDFPREFVLDNVIGTCTILDFARLHCPNLDLFYYFSTDEVFGPAPKGVDYKEWDRYNSGNPYSAAKAGGEELCLAYSNTYKMPMIITHCMNVFGERQHKEKYIPLCIDRVQKGEKIFIHSNKECTEAGSRFYIHTNDVTNAVMYLLGQWNKGNLKFCDKYNIVGSEEIDNLELANRIASILGKELNYELIDFHSSRPGHDLRYALDGSKMASLGWKPNSLDARLKQTVEWYLGNSEWLK